MFSELSVAALRYLFALALRLFFDFLVFRRLGGGVGGAELELSLLLPPVLGSEELDELELLLGELGEAGGGASRCFRAFLAFSL